MKRYFLSQDSKPNDAPSGSTKLDSNDVNNISKKARVELDEENDIIGDPGKRKPIDSYPIEIRDEMRRRYLAKGPCQPLGHNFPLSNFGDRKRKFQEAWFKNFVWLEYSVSEDAAFCLWCYLFGESNKHGEYAFTKIGFKNWKKAIQKLKEHEGCENSSHNYARTKCFGYKDQKHNVDYVLARSSGEMEIAYRIRLTAVVDVIRYLLGQGLAFRGHDESTQSTHRGNFLELITWYCERNEEVKKVMDSNAPENHQLTSPRIQKDIINACAMEVRSCILTEIGDKYFSLIIDEARDCSVKEQMSIVLRFVNDYGEVIERFLGVLHVSDTSALSLKNSIDGFFAKNGLSLSRLRGQGYDGASNMRGEFNGLKALILRENKYAHYIHCFAHQLQLVVVANVSQNGHVCSFFEYLSMIVNVAGASCKRRDDLRQRQYNDLIKRIEGGEVQTGKGKNQEIGLVRAGDTRWGSHFKTIIRLFQLWDPVKEVLQAVFEDGADSRSRGLAVGLVDKMENFEFVFIGHLMMRLLGMTNSLSQALQQKNQNISFAVRLIQALKDELKEFRNNGWDGLLYEVTVFCSTKEILVPNMEDIIPGRARKTVDGQRRTYIHHFRIDIFLAVVDIISRFSESNSELVMAIACLDPSNSFANFDLERIFHLAELYSEDFTTEDLMELKPQLRTYIHYVQREPDFSNLCDLGGLAKKMVELKADTAFHLIYRLMVLALVLPVTTATVERSFSALKFIKTDLRNKMGDDFLTDCLVCYIEKNIFVIIENEKILQRFQNMATRRLQLAPIV